jgi:glycosyltransferase involved in cell wall biosynthesis
MAAPDGSRNTRKVLLVGPKAPPYGGMSVQAGLLEEAMNREGVRAVLQTTHPPLPAFLEPIRGLRAFARSLIFCHQLWKRLADADVVHILGCSWVPFFFIVWPAIILCRLRGKRIVLNYHGGQADQFFRRYRRLVRPVLRMADTVTVPSGFLAEIIARRLEIEARIVPNIVALTAFPFRERKRFAPRLLTTRHLEKLYDVESVLRAFREVQQHYPDATLLVAGTGSQETYLRRLATDWTLENVRFLGYIRYQKLPSVYEECDILLNASRADNFPGSLIEAAAAGLAVVSTGVGGIPYIFEDGVSALLVAPGDCASLAAATLRILEEPGLGQRLTRGAFVESQKCDWKHVRMSLYQAYGFSTPAAFEGAEQSPREGEEDVNASVAR